MANKYSNLARELEPFIMRMILNVVGEQRATAVSTSVELNQILLYDESLTDYKAFGVTQAGFTSALAASGTGDVIVIPPGTIAGDHTITDGVKVFGLSRWATILTGQITGGPDSSIENLSIERTANDATTLIGVDSPASGTFYISGCDIEVVQSGSGDAYGISADVGSTVIEIWNSYVYGSSGSGFGYGAYRDTGTSAAAYQYGGRMRGSTGSTNV